MKKFIYIIALLFLLVACNEELQIDTKQPTIGNKQELTSQTFSFDSVTKPEIWKNSKHWKKCSLHARFLMTSYPISARRSWCKYVWTTLCLETSAYNDELVGIKK